VGRINREHKQYYPQPGWVEHDAEEIWRNVLLSASEVLVQAGAGAGDVAAIGITNQRETIVFWDKNSGAPLTKAIVWQCRRTADLCRRLKEEGYEEEVRQKTGLLLDPYFSGSKIRWALDNVSAVSEAAAEGRLCCGTIDCYLLFRLTGGRVFATDYSNASRTLLFNIHDLKWDEALLQLFGVPPDALPQVMPNSMIYGETTPGLFSGISIPIGGIAGDQQAALFGQACYEPGMTKNTYGTGCFLLMNEGRVEYALEGSIFITGAAVQWLRDGLGLISKAAELEGLAAQVEDNGGVYLVPAFAGLGAPHWDPYARGLIIGITGGTSSAHIGRAVIEAMAYQTRDVLDVMHQDAELPVKELRVDGGASVMDLLLQFQADITSTAVRRSATFDTTALGAAYLAGLACGFWQDLSELSEKWRGSAYFEPQMGADQRQKLYAGWSAAVKRSRGWVEEK